MNVRLRVTQSANAVNLHVSVRLPYDDLRAAWAVLSQALCRAWGRDGPDREG